MTKLFLTIMMVLALIVFAAPATACEEYPVVPNVDLGPTNGDIKNAAALGMLKPVLDTDKLQIALDAALYENRVAGGLSVGIPVIKDRLHIHGTVGHVFETDAYGTSFGTTFSF